MDVVRTYRIDAICTVLAGRLGLNNREVIIVATMLVDGLEASQRRADSAERAFSMLHGIDQTMRDIAVTISNWPVNQR
jgi:hypothetical protein